MKLYATSFLGRVYIIDTDIDPSVLNDDESHKEKGPPTKDSPIKPPPATQENKSSQHNTQS